VFHRHENLCKDSVFVSFVNFCLNDLLFAPLRLCVRFLFVTFVSSIALGYERPTHRLTIPALTAFSAIPGLSGLRRYHVAEIELRIGPDDVRRQRLLVKIEAVQHIVRVRISFG
jgi:hypothetical protein